MSQFFLLYLDRASRVSDCLLAPDESLLPSEYSNENQNWGKRAEKEITVLHIGTIFCTN